RKGTRTLSKGTRTRRKGTRTRRKGTRTLSKGTRTRRKGTRPRRKGTRTRRKGTRTLSKGTRPRRKGTRPRRKGTHPGRRGPPRSHAPVRGEGWSTSVGSRQHDAAMPTSRTAASARPRSSRRRPLKDGAHPRRADDDHAVDSAVPWRVSTSASKH